MRHGVLIRFNYPEGDEFDNRLRMFQNIVVPAFQNQTDKEFELVILCNPVHTLLFQAMGLVAVPAANGHTGYVTFQPVNGQLSGGYNFKNYEIQTRHDCDDLPGPGYIQRIKAECTGEAVKLLSFVPFKYDMRTGKFYGSAQRFEQQASMFLTLYKPGGKPETLNVYAHKHGLMGEYVRPVVRIAEGYCALVVHGGNKLTKMFPADRRRHIENFSWGEAV